MSEFMIGEHDLLALAGQPFSREHRAALVNLAELVMSWQRDMDMIRQAVFRLRSEEGGSSAATLWFHITASSPTGIHRWKYGFEQVTINADGESFAFIAGDDKITGTIASGWLLNSLEFLNDAVSPEGAGIPITGTPGSAAEILPLKNCIVPAWPFGVAPDGKTIWITSIANPLKIACTPGGVFPPVVEAASKFQGITPQSIIADILGAS